MLVCPPRLLCLAKWMFFQRTACSDQPCLGAVDLLAASSKECTYSDRHALVLPAHRIATRNVVGTMTGRVVGANNGCKLRYANGREEAAGSLRHP